MNRSLRKNLGIGLRIVFLPTRILSNGWSNIELSQRSNVVLTHRNQNGSIWSVRKRTLESHKIASNTDVNPVGSGTDVDVAEEFVAVLVAQQHEHRDVPLQDIDPARRYRFAAKFPATFFLT